MPLGFVLHVAGGLLVAQVLVPAGLTATDRGSVPLSLLGLFAVGLPGLVYVFLVGVWALRLVQNAVQTFR